MFLVFSRRGEQNSHFLWSVCFLISTSTQQPRNSPWRLVWPLLHHCCTPSIDFRNDGGRGLKQSLCREWTEMQWRETIYRNVSDLAWPQILACVLVASRQSLAALAECFMITIPRGHRSRLCLVQWSGLAYWSSLVVRIVVEELPTDLFWARPLSCRKKKKHRSSVIWCPFWNIVNFCPPRAGSRVVMWWDRPYLATLAHIPDALLHVFALSSCLLSSILSILLF